FDWLEEVVMSASTQTFVGGFGIMASGQDDDADFGPAAANFVHQPQPAATGHQEIGNNDGSQSLLQQFEGFFGTAGGLAFVTPGARRQAQDVPQARFVVHNRDADRFWIGIEPHDPPRGENRKRALFWSCPLYVQKRRLAS